MEDEDKLWDRIQEEIEHRDTSCLEVDPKIKLLKSQVESKLKVSHQLQSLTLFILGTLANSEDPDEMPHKGLHCLLR